MLRANSKLMRRQFDRLLFSRTRFRGGVGVWLRRPTWARVCRCRVVREKSRFSTGRATDSGRFGRAVYAKSGWFVREVGPLAARLGRFPLKRLTIPVSDAREAVRVVGQRSVPCLVLLAADNAQHLTPSMATVANRLRRPRSSCFLSTGCRAGW